MKAILLITSVISFASFGQEPAERNTSTSEHTSSHEVVEFINYPEAQYPGGYTELAKFIQENIVYPEAAIRDSVQGRVYIRAVVETDGSLTDIKVVRGVHPALDAEALRIVSIMPNWIPAEEGNRPVRSMIYLPISFVLEEE